jgi:hypothetical protein
MERKMNKEQRAPYLFLANFPIEGWGLCNWCKFAEWYGGSECGADSEIECKHPLDAINGKNLGPEEHAEEVWGEGADCWGFRPKATLQEMGVVAGIRSSGRIAHKNKSSEWVAIIPSERDREEMLV